MRSRFDNGPIEEWYELAEKRAPNYFNMFFKPYLQITKVCSTHRECGYEKDTPWKHLNGSTYNWRIVNDGSTRFFFYLSDGTFVAVATGSYGSGGIVNAPTPEMIIDINGNKVPNIIGKDVFFLKLDNTKGAVPYCNANDLTYVNNNCKRNGNGTCCLKKLMENSWNFKNNYPI